MLVHLHPRRRPQHQRQAALVSLSNSAVPATVDQLAQQAHPEVMASMVFLASLANLATAVLRTDQLLN